jgi:hypothetical protein
VTRFLLLALLASAAACKGKHEKRRAVVEDLGSAALPPDSPCQQLPFADASSVPEASGAAWLPVGGKLSLVVVSDSGNDGAYAVVDPETGETVESGKLALGATGDDLEGAAAWDGKLAAVSSSGWMHVWERDDAARGWKPAGEAYPMGAVTLPDKSDGNRPPQGDGMVCGAKATNCGRNYEGLCLVDAAHRKGPCVGFVAAKADGKLYCVTDEGGKLIAQHDRAIAITRPGALADCAFGDDGSLWAGSNLFDLGNVYAVTGWEDPATAKVAVLAPIGVGFPETLAVRGDVFYRMSDTGGSPSLMAKYRCKR